VRREARFGIVSDFEMAMLPCGKRLRIALQQAKLGAVGAAVWIGWLVVALSQNACKNLHS
jgi:hypothetical protein